MFLQKEEWRVSSPKEVFALKMKIQLKILSGGILQDLRLDFLRAKIDG